MNKQIYNANVSYSQISLKLKGSSRLASSNPDLLFHFYGVCQAQDGISNIREKAVVSPDLDIKHTMRSEASDSIGFARLAGIIEEQDLDIAQQVRLVMSKPQKKSKLFRMAGVIKEPFASDDD